MARLWSARATRSEATCSRDRLNPQLAEWSLPVIHRCVTLPPSSRHWYRQPPGRAVAHANQCMQDPPRLPLAIGSLEHTHTYKTCMCSQPTASNRLTRTKHACRLLAAFHSQSAAPSTRTRSKHACAHDRQPPADALTQNMHSLAIGSLQHSHSHKTCNLSRPTASSTRTRTKCRLLAAFHSQSAAHSTRTRSNNPCARDRQPQAHAHHRNIHAHCSPTSTRNWQPQAMALAQNMHSLAIGSQIPATPSILDSSFLPDPRRAWK